MRSALLIDGENVGSAHAGAILAAVSQETAILRVYGSAMELNGWTKIHDLRVIHADNGRNSADILLAIDAMEMAADGIGEFILVTKDGGLVHLVRRLREKGCRVVVMADEGASMALRAVAHGFVGLRTLEVPQVAQKALPSPPSARHAIESSVANRMETHVRNRVAQSKNVGLTIRQINKDARKAFPKCLESHISLDDWRKWVRARPTLFRIDPVGSQERVHLLSAPASPSP